MSTLQKTILFLMLLAVAGYLGYRWHTRTRWPAPERQQTGGGIKARLEEADKRETREHLHELVLVEATGHHRKRPAIGGITGAEVQVWNRTKYLLDQVRVRVEYLKRNGSVWRQEELVFDHLEPGKALRLPAPESRRGTALRCQVAQIHATELGL